MTLQEAQELNEKLKSKLNDIYIDFSNYGPSAGKLLLNDLDVAKDMLVKLMQWTNEMKD